MTDLLYPDLGGNGKGVVDLAAVLDSQETVNIMAHGAVRDWSGTRGTDNSGAIARAVGTGARNIYVPEGPFLTNKTTVLGFGQQIVGHPGGLYTDAATALEAELVYRPTDGSKVAIRNVADTNGQGVRGLTINMDDLTHTAIQFATCYGTIVTDVRLTGSFKWGIVKHNNFSCIIHNIDATGALIKAGIIFIGTYNAFDIRNIHSSNLPILVGDKLWGIAVNGAGSNLNIENAILQGLTTGIEIAPGSKGARVNAYFENTVNPYIIGDDTGGPAGVKIDGGAIGTCYADHPQVASRGPAAWLRGGSGINFDTNRWDDSPAPASATGPWPIVVGTQLIDVRVRSPAIVPVAGQYDAGLLLMREVADSSPNYMIEGTATNGFYAEERLVKGDSTFQANGFRLKTSNVGAQIATAYQPTIIPAAVSALLSTAMPSPTSILL